MADKPVNSLRELLDRLAELCTSLPERSDEDLRNDLRDQGVDPDRLLARMSSLMAEARSRSRQERFAAAGLALEEELTGLAAQLPSKRSRAELQARLRELAQQVGAEAQFREFNSASDADLEEMIAELELLANRGSDTE